MANEHEPGSFLTIAKNRYSCRNYQSTPVPHELIEQCIECARISPSACNSQPWSFVVVESQEARTKLCNSAFSGTHGATAAFAPKAPVIIVCVTETANYTARLGGWLRGVQYSLIDLGIATSHICLQAADLGLGTCIIGWFSESGVKEALNLPKSAKIDLVITLGYPADHAPAGKARKSMTDILKYA